jgi:ABC-2 type transport system permease protein
VAIQAFFFALAVRALTLFGRAFQVTLDPAHVLKISGSVFLLGVDFGLVALSIGAAAGRRGFTLGVTTAIAAVSYLLSSLAPVVHWLRPGKYLSLIYWSVGNDQLANGANAVNFVILVIVGMALLLGAANAFGRLDLH